MVPLAIAAAVTRARSYALFVLFLTPVFVLVENRWHADWHTAMARIVDVVVGGALAVVATLVSGSWERRRLPAALDAVRDALARYVDVALGAAVNQAALATARRDVGIALEEAEASLERMRAEPAPVRHGVDAAVALLTHGRRLAAALTALGDAPLAVAETTRCELRHYFRRALARAPADASDDQTALLVACMTAPLGASDFRHIRE